MTMQRPGPLARRMVLKDRGRQMVAVGDDRGRQVVVGQAGPHGVVVPRQQGGHAVAEMGEGLGPDLDQLLQVLLLGHVVSQGHGDPVAAA